MKTIIQGKVLRTTYRVDSKRKKIIDEDGIVKLVFNGKPELTEETNVVEWKTIKELNEDIQFNCNDESIHYDYLIGNINLNEKESVEVLEKIFRLDLEAYVLHVDKVLDKSEENKEIAEKMLKQDLERFNLEIINSNEKLVAYCRMHNLEPSKTDVFELIKLLHPNEAYFVKDGKLVKGSTITLSNYGYSRFGVLPVRNLVISDVGTLNNN